MFVLHRKQREDAGGAKTLQGFLSSATSSVGGSGGGGGMTFCTQNLHSEEGCDTTPRSTSHFVQN
jgi:hypothetical protein